MDGLGGPVALRWVVWIRIQRRIWVRRRRGDRCRVGDGGRRVVALARRRRSSGARVPDAVGRRSIAVSPSGSVFTGGA